MSVPSDRKSDVDCDLLVVGGGINGCGIARDAAGRGARVILLEAGDLASGTSSASTKLIHGGLRYLEHFEFALVREALAERERLWAIAPHIIWPLRFVLPHVKGLRPRWLLRLGLFLYDHIGGRKRLPPTETIALARHEAGEALKDEFDRAFVYSDCWVDDARLVVLNARDAADRGAQVCTHCPAQSIERIEGGWRVATAQRSFTARALVNATGPSAERFLRANGLPSARHIRLVRGSHIVVARLFDHPFAYFFQLPDGRIFFAIPYEGAFTLIGTTDQDHDGPLDDIRASEEEIAYLCEGANRFFRRAISPADVVWSYSGVRALADDGSDRPEAATRGYHLDLSEPDEGAPLLTVFGGKITSYRHLAEEALDKLDKRLALGGTRWTASAPLPGGDFAIEEAASLPARIAARYAFLKAGHAARLARSYGTLSFDILGKAQSLSDCGEYFGHGLTERELRYLFEREWARSAQDVLWRRTKLGLHLDSGAQQRLSRFIDRELA